MKETRQINLGEDEYLFINESISTRSGFAHVTSLLRNGVEVSNARCNYLNRTWEEYRFQASMRKAVWQLIEDKQGRITNQLKNENGWQKVTVKRRKQVEEAFANDEHLKDYRTVLNQL